MPQAQRPEQREGTAILCPKCVSQMLPLQRFGVTIEQCTGCGGIFLDRGELEELAAAEARFYTSAQPPAPAQQYAPPPPQAYPPPGYGQRRHGGFIEELFGGGRHGGHHGGHH